MKNKKELDDFLMASEKIELGLLDKHVHFLSGEISEKNIEDTIKWIVYESTIGPADKILTLYINSIGGFLADSFALIDMMKISKYQIKTIGIGSICSAAFLIFSAGTKGKRFIAKNTSIMCHQYSDEISGKHHDIKAHLKEAELTNERMVQVLKNNTNLDVKAIKSKLLPPSDVWLTPDKLIEYGIADHFLT